MTTVAVLVGSASADSLNRRLARALELAAPEGMEFVDVPIAHLPFIAPEHDANMPAEALEFQRAITEADAVLLVTPEYNRDVPAVLKNAIDWTSRPWGTNLLGGKPVMIAGAAIGATGSAVAQAHLRSLVSYFNADLLTRPELYIQISKEQFDAEGRATKEGTQELLASAMEAFAEHIATTRR